MTSTRPSLAPLDARIRLAALWTSTVFIVAFVDIFSFYRPDYREQIEAGRVFVFEIGQPFLLGIALYVTIASLMVGLSMLLPHRANRLTNLIVAPLFTLTIIGASIGEWAYYLVASAVEVALLAMICGIAAKWTVPAPRLIANPLAESAV